MTAWSRIYIYIYISKIQLEYTKISTFILSLDEAYK